MIINTPIPGSTDVVPKEVSVGCGVKLILEGTRFTTEGTVVAIHEGPPPSFDVKGHGFEARVGVAAIRDVFSPEVHQYQELYNKAISTTHRPAEADKDWPDIPA